MMTYSKKARAWLVLPALALVPASFSHGFAQQTPAQRSDGTSRYDARENYSFRSDQEREKLRGKSAYLKFQDQEGIPVYRGFAVNLYDVKLGPWKRLGPGVTGAYFNLDGSGDVTNNVVTEIEPGHRTNPERHISEEYLVVLSGEGETRIWQSDPKKYVVIPWQKGTILSPPLNTWHQHIAKGSVPARMVATTDLPLKLDLFGDPKFIFENDRVFTDRWDGSPTSSIPTSRPITDRWRRTGAIRSRSSISYATPGTGGSSSPGRATRTSTATSSCPATTWRATSSSSRWGPTSAPTIMGLPPPSC
ncbi:MAG: cupin domain-containing protein [Sphingomonas sp.]